MRFFNTAGACEPALHYMLPAAPRLSDADRLFEQGAYLALHAPRQSGKTTTLRALAQQVTAQGRYTALYLSCKVAECAVGEVEASQVAILSEVRAQAAFHLSAKLQPPSWPEVCA